MKCALLSFETTILRYFQIIRSCLSIDHAITQFSIHPPSPLFQPAYSVILKSKFSSSCMLFCCCWVFFVAVNNSLSSSIKKTLRLSSLHLESSKLLFVVCVSIKYQCGGMYYWSLLLVFHHSSLIIKFAIKIFRFLCAIN